MNKKLFNRTLQLILPQMGDADERKALVESALFGSPILDHIQWEGAARPFTVRLIRQLHDFGELEEDKLAIVALLEEIQTQVGEDRKTQLATLITQITTPPEIQTIIAPETKIEGDLYVFISYARPDQAIAEKVEQYLQAVGVKVFRDTSEIRDGSNWDMTIEKALHDCDRMVLLLSGSSMPYRKEVHREWFFFDQKRKPIYPLYLEDCELHSRMFAYNYIDAQTDLQSALDRLLKELGRDYALPDSALGVDKVGVFEDVVVPRRTLPEALQELLDAIRDPEGSVVLSIEQATAIKDHKPVDMIQYRLGRIAEWALPRYQLDNRFVNLTMMLDKGEDAQQRWQKAEDFRFDDLRDVLAKVPDPVLVLLGAPGSGKSTLLRRLQLDHSMDELRADGGQMSFFIQLNGYRKDADDRLPDPREWLATRWSTQYPDLPALETFLQSGKMLLLLDALNEMPHKNTAEYHERAKLCCAAHVVTNAPFQSTKHRHDQEVSSIEMERGDLSLISISTE
jgi:5-carboxymethyl-2-hydroxymuconate isomerase